MGLELQFSLSTILPFFFFFFLFMVLNIIWRSKAKYSNSRLPPGPSKLPLIGNIHHLGALPHHSLASLANQYGPLMHIQLGELSCMVVSSPEMAKEVMNTHDTIFASRPHVLSVDVITYGSKGITFSPLGTHWRQMRKICTMELLAPKRVMSFRSIREEELSNLVKDISLRSEGSPINLSDEFDSLAYGLTSRIAFGGKPKDQHAYIEFMKHAIEAVAGFSIADVYPSLGVLQVLTGFRTKIKKLHQEADRILESIVEDHREKSLDTKAVRQEEGEDLVDILLRLQKHGDLQLPLSDSVVKATILDIFSAGSDTAATTMEWAMSEMVKNPRVMEKAQLEVRRVFGEKGYVDEASIHELKYLRSVLKETLRLHPPLPLLLPRECSENCELSGYEIPAKSKVIVNAWAIGRDPNYWIEPDKFYPERFLDSSIEYNGAEFQFIPFGAGRRMCPGITFGTVNVELSLANLLFHFDWKMPEGNKPEELDMTESFGLSVRRKFDLQLIPIRHQSPTSFSHDPL